MRLEFDKIWLRDFRSFVGWHKLDLRGIGSGCHFLKGLNHRMRPADPNGAGKTSIFDALSWCLFGKTGEGLRGNDLRSWYPETEGPAVKLIFRIDGEKHIILREHHPNSLTFDNRAIAQMDLERRLNLSFEVYHHTIAFGQRRPLFFDLEPRRKMEVFSETLQLQRWEKWSAVAANRCKEIQTELDKVTTQLQSSLNQEAELKSLLKQTRLQSEDWQAQAGSRQKTLETEIKSLRKQIDHFQRIVDDADLAYDGAMIELPPLQKQIKQITDDLRLMESDWRATEQLEQMQLNDLRRECRAIKELQQYQNCPTCGQPLRSAAAKRDHLQEIQCKIDRLVDHPAQPPKDLQRQRDKHRLLDEAFEQIQTKANNAIDMLDRYRPELQAVKARQDMLQKQLNEKWEETNPHRETIDHLRDRLDHLNLAIEESEKQRRKYEKRLERTQFWIKAFKDIRLYIIDDVLAELDLMTNSILAEVGLAGWEIHYDIERETKKGTVIRGLDVRVLSPDNRKPVKWEVWSGGEGQRLRLVGSLALSEVLLARAGLAINFQVFDEPSQHLSAQGVAGFGILLEDWAARSGRTIFYVDHAAQEAAHFASTILVEKKSKTGSRIITFAGPVESGQGDADQRALGAN